MERIKQYLKNDDIMPLILLGDVIKQLEELPDNCIDVVITSPPYWQQRDYSENGQIGQEERIEEYIQKMVDVGLEVWRVLKDSGSYFLNIGDKYVNKDLQMIPAKVCIALQSNGWILRNQIIWYKPNHMPSPITDRLSNTWESVFFLVKDNNSYLSPRYYFNLDAIRVEHKTENDGIPEDLPYIVSEEDYPKIMEVLRKYQTEYNGKFKDEDLNKGASPGARTSVSGLNYSKQRIFKTTEEEELMIIEYLRTYKQKLGLTTASIDELMGYKHTAGHWFRMDKGGRSLPNPKDWIKLKEILNFDNTFDDKMTKMHYILQAVRNHPNGKNPGDKWDINVEKTNYEHFAIFPEKLVELIIKMACPEKGIVLDIFGGSGTTGKIAMDLKRKSIMIEISEQSIEIMMERFKNASK